MRYSDIKKLFIFNSFIFSIIIVLGVIMLFRASYAHLYNGANDAWDGTVATSFAGGSGTSSSPYQIANGAQLALFIKRCNENTSTYANKYYVLTSNIYLNDGYFDYSSTDFPYYRDNKRYYIGNRNKYYTSPSLTNEVGTLNCLDDPSFTFSGNFDGNNHSIYGLYYNNPDSDASFLKMLSGTLKNVRFVDAIIMGGGSSGLIWSLSGGTVNNVVYNGLIKSTGKLVNSGTGSAYQNASNHIEMVAPSSSNELHPYRKYVLTGKSNYPFMYNGENYSSSGFTIEFDSFVSSIDVTGPGGVMFSNLELRAQTYDDDVGLISCVMGSGNIVDVTVSGKVQGCGAVGGIIGSAPASYFNISRSYSRAILTGIDLVGGICGEASVANSNIGMSNVFSSFDYSTGALYSGGLFGGLSFTSNGLKINLSKSFVSSHPAYHLSGEFVGYFKNYSSSRINITSPCYYDYSNGHLIGNNTGVTMSNFTYKAKSSLLSTSNLNSMQFLKYGDGSVSNGYVWYLTDGQIPHLYTDDVSAPSFSIMVGGTANNVTSGLSIKHVAARTQVSITGIDNNSGIADINYLILSGYRTGLPGSPVQSWGWNNSTVYTSPITINENDCFVIVVRVRDAFGNVAYLHSDLLFCDMYKTTFTEGVDSSNSSGKYDNYRSDSVVNVYYKHSFEAASGYSLPYDSNLRQYLRLSSTLPTGTVIRLYDKASTKEVYTYTTTSSTSYTSLPMGFYLFDLSNLKSIYDSTLSYNNLVSNYISNNKINENFVLSFKFPDNNYSFGTSSRTVGVVTATRSAVDNHVYSGLFYYNVVKKSSSNKMNYYLDASASGYNTGDSLSINTVNTEYNIDLQFSIKLPLNDSNSKIYVPGFYDKRFNLKIKLLGPNGEDLTPLIGDNLSFQYIRDSYSGTVFNSKVDSVAYYNFEPLLYPMQDAYGTYYNSSSRIKMTVKSTNFLNIMNSYNYKLRFIIEDRYHEVVTSDLNLSILKAQPIDNYSFEASVVRNDRIVNASTGKTLDNNNYFDIIYKYSGSFFDKKILVSLYKYDEVDDDVEFVPVAPTTLFSNSFTGLGNNLYEVTNNVCNPDISCLQRLNLKSGLTTGTYSLYFIYRNSGIDVSNEVFNIIVK